MRRSTSLGLIGFLLAGSCSVFPSTDPVFVGADHRTFACIDRLGATCVQVSSQVAGSHDGTGSCILYAVTDGGRVAVAASGELELTPGSMVEWTVPVPSHFDMWNAACSPTAEG